MKLHGAMVFAALALGACTEETVQYVTRPFVPGKDTANGFLGYFTVSEKQTNCGNCHVDHQAKWKGTAHAQAWANLQADPNPPDKSSCVGCHTVNDYGNLAPHPAGYLLVKDSAYHDVQCESCHGPGFDHASVPDAGDAPLASIAIDTSTSAPSDVGTCAACHSGTHHPYAEEWRQSLHARMGRQADELYCQRCHTGQGALRSWGVNAAYIGSEVPVTPATALGITCAVCHDPHNATNPGQLRWPLETTDPDQNLCMKCHYRRTEPLALDSSRIESPGGSNSPHAPQGATVIGEVGYQNPTYLDPVLVEVAKSTSHGSLTKNPKLCAGCHLYAFPTTDTAGTFNQATGHLFRPLPCYGADGLPTNTIKNCAYAPAERSFKACAVSGCHASENEPAGLLSVVRDRIQTLTTALWVNSNTANSGIDTLDQGLIPVILKNTWSQRGTLNNLTLFVNGAVPAGDSVINFDAASLTGNLAQGNTLQIGSTQYTVTATVTAAANQLNGVHVTPPFAVAVADNAKVFVMMLAPLLAGDRVITALDGAEFNVRTVGEDANGAFFGSTADRSHTVHNTFLAEALLRANIAELKAIYGSQPWFPPLSPAVQRIMSGPLGATGRIPWTTPPSRAASSP